MIKYSPYAIIGAILWHIFLFFKERPEINVDFIGHQIISIMAISFILTLVVFSLESFIKSLRN